MVLTKGIHVGRSVHGFLAWTTKLDSTYTFDPLSYLLSPVIFLLYLPNSMTHS